ncbi:MAG: DNA polymerase III subunit gamma/tau, partial [Lysobacterales bacterium]
VRAMLGTLDRSHVYALLEALAEGDGPTLMACIENMASEVTDYAEALAELVSELQRIAVAQIVPDAAPADDDSAVARKALAQSFSAEDVQLYYQMGIMGGRDLALAPDPRSGFEMALLRMLAFRPAGMGSAGGAAPGAAQPSKAQPSPTPREKPPAAENAPAVNVARTIRAEEWAADIEAMGLVGLTRELAFNCLVVASTEGGIKLQLDPGHEQLTAPRVKEKLEHALERYCGRRLKVDIHIAAPEGETPALARQREIALRQQAAVRAIENDSGVQAICDTFGAVIDEERVRPVD